jgi:hypothetical protein
MSNTRSFAERELEILVKSNIDPENRPIIEEFIPEILALCEKFGNSGQSGGSAPYTAKSLSKTIEKLCLQKPICPITGIDEEWVDVSSYGDGEPMWQNSRCSGLFKDKHGEVKYVDAIIKRTQKKFTYSGSFWLNKKDYLNGNRDLKITSSQYVKEFPFIPKTFYIDVIEEEVAPDNWEMFLKDKSQLDEVFEYYKPKPITREVLFEKEEKIF